MLKPFLKWAGGKVQLLPAIQQYYPPIGSIDRYVEPFLGGGAVLFDVLEHYKGTLKEVVVNDVNLGLTQAYTSIRDDVEQLISYLSLYNNLFLYNDMTGRHIIYDRARFRYNDLLYYFTQKQADPEAVFQNNDRTQTLIDFNSLPPDLEIEYDIAVEFASLFIFLNRTCFNGVYRVNNSGEFNVAMGDRTNPGICNSPILRKASSLLKDVTILSTDYSKSLEGVNERTFVYMDPPYRPIVENAVTLYTRTFFDDNCQRTLTEVATSLVDKGAYVLLSNADPKNVNENDNFFDDLYCKFNIVRCQASRTISGITKGRGVVSELLISSPNLRLPEKLGVKALMPTTLKEGTNDIELVLPK